MEERGLRSNEKVTKQLDYQTRKMVSPQTDVNLKKENSNPMDQNNSTYSLKGYERQTPYSSNQFDQNRQTGEQQKMLSNNNPYLKQSLYNNPEQGKTFIRSQQEGDLRKPLDQVNYKQESRQINEREVMSPYVNFENQKRDPIGTRTPLDPRVNMSTYTPQSRQDIYRKDVQQSDYKREFQLPEYKRMYPGQDSRIPPRQINSFEMQQKPLDQQGDRIRYDQERIRTLGGQQEQPERMDRMIRASDYVRKSDNQDLQEQDRKPLERREFNQRGVVELGLIDQRNNTSKSQEYSQRQQNQVRKYQEGSKTPIEGRMIERRGFEDQIQLEGRFYQQQQHPQNPYVEGARQQFYEVKPPLDEQRRIANPYDDRRNTNPYETKPQVQDQRLPFERRPDRVEFERRPDRVDLERRPDRVDLERRPDRVDLERRPDRVEFERKPDRVEGERRPDRMEFERRPDRVEFERRPDFDRRPDRPDFEKKPERPELEGRSPYQARFGPEGRFDADQRLPPDFRYRQQGYNNERSQQQGIRQGVEGIQAQRMQFEERPAYCPDGLQDGRQGMNYRKYSDGRSIQDGRGEGRDVLEGRSGVMDGKQYQIDGRAGFNRTYGEDKYQGTTIFEGRPGLEGRREQFCTRPPLQSRPFEERGNIEQRVPIESRNQYQRGYDDKFGDKYFEQKYSQQQDPIGRKDLSRPENGKMREEFDRRTTYGRSDMEDKMSEFGKRKEVDGRMRPETSFGRPNGIAQQPGERYYRREYNDQGQRLSYHEDTSVIDRLGLERGTNRNVIGNQAAENMLRGGQIMNRQYDRERSFNRLGMGDRVASFTNSKVGYQRTAYQDKEEYQGYVRSKLMPKPLGNGATEFQRKQSQDQGFQKLQSPKGQVETRVGIYDIQRRDGRI